MTDKILIDRAVVEQALATLRMYEPSVVKFGLTFKHGQDAIAAISAALEQPQVEQEPVAWCHLHYYEDGSYFADCLQHYQDDYCKTPTYLHPQQGEVND